MHKLAAAAATLLLFTLPSQAAEIRVLAPGLIGPGILTLAQRWGAETGNKVVAPDGGPTVGKVGQLVQSGAVYDLVLLPPADLAGFSAKFKPGSEKPVGRVVFTLVVKAGALHPDISTPAKFRAALDGKSVAYNDPASGSIAGRMVDALLKEPGYAGVKRTPAKGLAANAVAAGDAQMAVAVEGEVVAVKGVDIVGPVPDGVDLKLTVSAAVPLNAAHPDEAAAFLAYLDRPESAAVWGPTGIALVRP